MKRVGLVAVGLFVAAAMSMPVCTQTAVPAAQANARPTATDCFSEIESEVGEHAYPLGDMPLAVISTPNEAPGYRELQAKLMALSRSSEQVVAENSSHMVPIDEPEVITQAIRKVVEEERRRGSARK